MISESAGSAPSASPAPPEHELSFVRYFIASREQVFDAWTRREALRRWWGPEDHELIVCDVDPRPGGAFHLVLRGPDGREWPSTGSYLEVQRPSRLRFAEELPDAPGEHFVTTVELEELGAMTRMTVGQTAARSEPLAHLQLPGMLESLTRLSELLLPH